MRPVYINVPDPWRKQGVSYNGPMLEACKQACGNYVVDLERWVVEQDSRIARGEVPVFMLLNHGLVLNAMETCRLNDWDFISIDHPHASEMRINAKSDDWDDQKHRMVRLSVNGIYAPYRESAPIWPSRTFDWNLQPWRTNLPRIILYCPSAADFYGHDWLGRDQSLEPEFMGMIEDYKQMGLLRVEWKPVLRSRFESMWAEQHQDIRPGAKEAILASGCTADGNSGIHFDALRLGTPAFIWRHPDKPLANTLASYAPLTLDLLDYPAIWKIEREPLFAQLAMSQCTLEELANPVMFQKLVSWQLEHLFG